MTINFKQRTMNKKKSFTGLTDNHVGSGFTGSINGTTLSGRIQKQDGTFYLCQNEKEGFSCMDKLGFSYSYSVENGTPTDLDEQSVDIRSITKIVIEVEEFREARTTVKLNSDYTATIVVGDSIYVGCQKIPITAIREVLATYDELNRKEEQLIV